MKLQSTNIQVLGRMAKILNLLENGQVWRLKEVSTITRLHLSTCHRILGDLVNIGLVNSHGHGLYVINGKGVLAMLSDVCIKDLSNDRLTAVNTQDFLTLLNSAPHQTFCDMASPEMSPGQVCTCVKGRYDHVTKGG